MLLLALATSVNPRSMDLPNVDRELSGIVYSARGGWLLHQLTHYECNDAGRKYQNGQIFRDYKNLEREYKNLGGDFASNANQEIMLESVHYHCSGGFSYSEVYWEKEIARVESDLSMMRSLLSRKRQLLRKK
jgi:hypothetical protein